MIAVAFGTSFIVRRLTGSYSIVFLGTLLSVLVALWIPLDMILPNNTALFPPEVFVVSFVLVLLVFTFQSTSENPSSKMVSLTELRLLQLMITGPSILILLAVMYGSSLYSQVTPVLGGGLPITARLIMSQEGADVVAMFASTQNSKRMIEVQIIHQTTDSYIILINDNVAAIDKGLVKSVLYSP